SAFGANSKFNNAFQNSLKKKSFLDTDSSTDQETKKEESKSPSAEKSKLESSGSSTPQQYKQVDLTPVPEIKTGEENEKSLYSVTAKIFELNLTKISEGWKERGLGPLHLNESIDDPSQVRLVMRSQGLLRVVLNLKVTPSLNLIKGLEASLSPGKFMRINSISDKGYPVQYLLKFNNENIRNELFDKIEDLKKTMKI
ncbi:PH domain-like protein, partial [Hyphopichia burtonii NRRL Y-1933]